MSAVLSCMLKTKVYENCKLLFNVKQGRGKQEIDEDTFLQVVKQAVQDFEVVNQCKQLFRLIDIDESGSIELEEAKHKIQTSEQVRGFLYASNELKGLLDEQHFETVFEEMDGDGSGSLSLDEFIQVNLNDHRQAQCHSDACFLFKQIDTNESGSITKEEFVQAIKENPVYFQSFFKLMGPAVSSLQDPALFQETFENMDVDESGCISRDEFAYACCQFLAYK